MTRFPEYLIEYDVNNLVVYVNGLDKDGFWWHLETHEDVNSPEDFAQGLEQAYLRMGLEVSVEAVTV